MTFFPCICRKGKCNNPGTSGCLMDRGNRPDDEIEDLDEIPDPDGEDESLMVTDLGGRDEES